VIPQLFLKVLFPLQF